MMKITLIKVWLNVQNVGGSFLELQENGIARFAIKVAQNREALVFVITDEVDRCFVKFYLNH